MIGALLLLVGLLLVVTLVSGFLLQVLWALLVGLVVGAVGRLLVPGKQDISLLMTALIGVAGGFVGGLLAGWLSLGSILSLVLQLGTAAALVAVAAGRSDSRRALTR